MIAAVDVQYAATSAAGACVTFDSWTDEAASGEFTALTSDIAPYVPGELWRRELPCILAVLGTLASAPSIVVIDGYVWLDDAGRRGLGAHLFEALGGGTPVIGVAKTAFCGSPHARFVLRGASQSPLYVTSSGIAVEDAARAIDAMHGPYRLPALLKRADRLCREALLVGGTGASGTTPLGFRLLPSIEKS
jgi:deoxyribonuclease V